MPTDWPSAKEEHTVSDCQTRKKGTMLSDKTMGALYTSVLGISKYRI